MPYSHRTISICIMPTQREYDRENPEIKADSRPSHRLGFLDPVRSRPAITLVMRLAVGIMAVYGLYSMFLHIV